MNPSSIKNHLKETFSCFIHGQLNRYAPSILKTPVKNKKSIPIESWMIKIDGNFIVTGSNKSVWRKIGHAKSALRLHFEQAHSMWNVKAREYKDLISGWREQDAIYEEEYQKFLTEHVEFVNVAVPMVKQIHGYLYDDRSKDPDIYPIKETLADSNGYWMVTLVDGEVGLINKETNAYISEDKLFFYFKQDGNG
jgi:hypothetical protein